jgi:hypothetical protein
MRIWGEGMKALNLYCFDFVDDECNPVNTPPGWILTTVHDSMPSTRVASMEECMGPMGTGQTDIRPGEEKYTVHEGLRIRISIPRQGGVMVEIPRREPLLIAPVLCAFSASLL